MSPKKPPVTSLPKQSASTAGKLNGRVFFFQLLNDVLSHILIFIVLVPMHSIAETKIQCNETDRRISGSQIYTSIGLLSFHFSDYRELSKANCPFCNSKNSHAER